MEYRFTVTVNCEDGFLAHLVMAERLWHDEDYGFPYTVDWELSNKEENEYDTCTRTV
jgi:hypothetical protein